MRLILHNLCCTSARRAYQEHAAPIKYKPNCIAIKWAVVALPGDYTSSYPLSLSLHLPNTSDMNVFRRQLKQERALSGALESEHRRAIKRQERSRRQRNISKNVYQWHRLYCSSTCCAPRFLLFDCCL